ncbi:MAG: NAD-dependent epimerase/dehydratase family protein [Ignavibacteria bacterium]|jgi:nucleoside-diphosphate-sugar epimerase
MVVDKNLIFGITGANGYLGTSIKNYLRKSGYKVYEYRHDIKDINEDSFPFSLEGDLNQAIFNKINILIHCAFDFTYINWRDIYNVNVLGSEKLFSVAKAAGVGNIIYISSMSAFCGCKSLYGKSKLCIEERALKHGAVVIRPGLIFGKNARGMVGSLSKMISISPVIPLIGLGHQKLYLIHQEDLCKLILNLCNNGSSYAKPIIAAYPQYKTFRDILKVIASSIGSNSIFIPFPWQIIWIILKFAELLHVKLGFRSDSLISLVNQDPDADLEYIMTSGILFRDFDTNTLNQ